MNNHKYTIIIRDAKSNKLLGRLTPEGTATNRVLFAAMFDKDQADEIAADINSGDEFTAKVTKF